MTTIVLLNDVNEEHLQAVKTEMAALGCPSIRAIDDGYRLIAIEGSHRLRAAEELGIAVNIEIVEEDADIDLYTLDWDHGGWFDERVVSGREFIEGFLRYPISDNHPTAVIQVI
ncbi:hypothetical protein [Sinorhizobium fredii]|uniref:hypothetical protein n=1 Tax=Rhizobium fredii TaxID=380 RepID=UPI0004B35C16|nr:hypothetical protein [Sinorhizobium fredii]AWM24079.1 hypothetical protein AOX55_0000802 [Sinorhizobium fredii CCBAU 25509]